MENQKTISDWARETFGPTLSMAVATRMNVEMAELLDALCRQGTNVWADVEQRRELAEAASAECADVLIMLYQIADLLGADLHAQVDAKMAVNRGRVWGRLPNGRLQHVADQVPDASTECFGGFGGPSCERDGVVYTLPSAEAPRRFFKDPACGLVMSTDLWYVLTDSGSAYHPRGFPTVGAAVAWASSDEFAGQFGRQPCTVPAYVDSQAGWKGVEAVNIFKGADMLDWARGNYADLIEYVNERGEPQ